jgi:hypothetical protein
MVAPWGVVVQITYSLSAAYPTSHTVQPTSQYKSALTKLTTYPPCLPPVSTQPHPFPRQHALTSYKVSDHALATRGKPHDGHSHPHPRSILHLHDPLNPHGTQLISPVTGLLDSRKEFFDSSERSESPRIFAARKQCIGWTKKNGKLTQ